MIFEQPAIDFNGFVNLLLVLIILGCIARRAIVKSNLELKQRGDENEHKEDIKDRKKRKQAEAVKEIHDFLESVQHHFGNIIVVPPVRNGNEQEVRIELLSEPLTTIGFITVNIFAFNSGGQLSITYDGVVIETYVLNEENITAALNEMLELLDKDDKVIKFKKRRINY